LWIRTIFSTRSVVYVTSNALDKACIWFERKLDKNHQPPEEAVSAQSFLWIFSELSTAGMDGLLLCLPEVNFSMRTA
jgi:hypothetical protein